MQEFQWSRSLTTLLLTMTPNCRRNLPARLLCQFLFSQLWYLIYTDRCVFQHFHSAKVIEFRRSEREGFTREIEPKCSIVGNFEVSAATCNRAPKNKCAIFLVVDHSAILCHVHRYVRQQFEFSGV